MNIPVIADLQAQGEQLGTSSNFSAHDDLEGSVKGYAKSKEGKTYFHNGNGYILVDSQNTTKNQKKQSQTDNTVPSEGKLTKVKDKILPGHKN